VAEATGWIPPRQQTQQRGRERTATQSSKERTPPWNLFLTTLDQSHLMTRASL
jgi:hypothetical protein